MDDGGYGRVLDESLAERCRTEDPVVCAFFRSPRPGEKPRRAVSTERWVTAKLDGNASLQTVQETAQLVSDELVTTPVGLMHEMLMGEPRLLPELPKWADGEDLRSEEGRLRFGVLGGNRGVLTGNIVSDLKRAYVRLISMNSREPLGASETVRVVCWSGLVADFAKARDLVPFEFETLEQPELGSYDPWFLIRQPVAVIKMEKPLSAPVVRDGSFLRLGVRYTIWLDNPSSLVCNMRPEMTTAKS